ncbi:DUF4115 domain-containing protein [Cyanobium sp. CH-040]|uniref:DUF4115 domain-containing protein n=1 Tax=Cyanobium sp. CH-040 TaxID=2823708 RepID=UPI0020CED7F6|nr:RodZ domain-containing protein [Cyanobium sp. CH-040]MCP9928316.1 DUF4115 domain-containing protein [Cyanobium sp. CH-040]
MAQPPVPESSPGPPIEEPSVAELEQELTRVKAELEEYQGLIEELPSIYEGKFRHQLHDVAQDIRRLLDEQQALQDQIRHALAAASQPAALPAAVAVAKPPEPPSALAPSHGWWLQLLAGLRGRGSAAAVEPSASSRTRLLLTAAITTLAVAALVAGLGLWRRSRGPQLATPAAPQAAAPTPGPASAPKPASQPDPDQEPQLRLRFNGECWIEVQTLTGETVLVNTFQDGETRSLPIGEGLRLLAGRPDLLEVSVGEGEFRSVGPIDRIDWVVIRAPDRPEGSS